MYDSFTQRGRELDRDVDPRLDRRDVPGGRDSKIGQLLDVAYNIEYGAESSRPELAQHASTCSATAGMGKLRLFGAVEREVPRAWAATTRCPRGSPTARRADHHGLASSSRSAVTAAGRWELTFRQGSRTRTVPADRVVLALPFSILRESVDFSKAGFEPLKETAIREQGMGTNSKLHVQFNEPVLEAARAQRRDVLRPRLPEHVGGDARAARRRRGSSSTTPAATIGASFGDRHARSRARSSSSRRSSRCFPVRSRPGTARRRRLLAGQPVDEGLVLVLEGRAVHEVRRHRAAARGQRATSRASTRRSTSRAT